MKTGKLELKQVIAYSILIPYLFLVLASTVLNRPEQSRMTYELQLFWSYQAAFHGRKNLLKENFLNILMLMPVGILYPIAGKHGFRKVVITGFLCSALIECSQLIWKRGLFELDDIFHNTLGVVVGYGIIRIYIFLLFPLLKKIFS